MQYTLKPDSQGNIIVDNKAGTYKPGDTLCIPSKTKSVLFSNFKGELNNRFNISNVPGEKLVVGNPDWNGGGYSYALMFRRCSHLNLFATEKGAFSVSGSVTTKVDRGAYFNVRFEDLCDNIKVSGLSIQDGGNAIWCKTEVSKTDPNTCWPNYQENFIFEDLDIKNTYTEGMYIGHSATYWDVNNNTPYYPDPSVKVTDLDRYKRPIKLKNVIIRNCRLEGCGFDGVQTAAIDGLQVYNNEVINWGGRKVGGDNQGILIGGRVKGFSVHDNNVHDGWGPLMAVLAEGGGESIVKNNLLVNTAFGEGIFIRGTDGLITTVSNNTIAGTASQPLRVNGSKGGVDKQIFQDNILVGPTSFSDGMGNRNYIYEENGGTFVDSNNVKFRTLADAKLDSTYQPLADSKGLGLGYKKTITDPPKPEPPKPEPPVEEPKKVYITGAELLEMIKGSSLEITVDPVTKKITFTVQ